MKHLTCARCGEGFPLPVKRGRPRLYCFVCRPARGRGYKVRKLHTNICEVCTTPFPTDRLATRFCSRKCQGVAYSLTQHPPCEWCGRSFRKSHTEQRTCGRACGAMLKRKKQTALKWSVCSVCGETWVANQRRRHCEPVVQERPDERDCEWCGKTFPYRPLARYCSKRCKDYCHPQRMRAQPIAYGECTRCGVLFVGRASQVGAFCSEGCAKAARRRRRKKGLRNAPRREPYTLRQVAIRDGWRCHICKRIVPDRPYAARDRDPTVDHLVPVAPPWYGTDTLDNVALAHNRCNWQRSVGGEVQLRLTA